VFFGVWFRVAVYLITQKQHTVAIPLRVVKVKAKSIAGASAGKKEDFFGRERPFPESVEFKGFRELDRVGWVRL